MDQGEGGGLGPPGAGPTDHRSQAPACSPRRPPGDTVLTSAAPGRGLRDAADGRRAIDAAAPRAPERGPGIEAGRRAAAHRRAGPAPDASARTVDPTARRDRCTRRPAGHRGAGGARRARPRLCRAHHLALADARSSPGTSSWCGGRRGAGRSRTARRRSARRTRPRRDRRPRPRVPGVGRVLDAPVAGADGPGGGRNGSRTGASTGGWYVPGDAVGTPDGAAVAGGAPSHPAPPSTTRRGRRPGPDGDAAMPEAGDGRPDRGGFRPAGGCRRTPAAAARG